MAKPPLNLMWNNKGEMVLLGNHNFDDSKWRFLWPPWYSLQSTRVFFWGQFFHIKIVQNQNNSTFRRFRHFERNEAKVVQCKDIQTPAFVDFELVTLVLNLGRLCLSLLSTVFLLRLLAEFSNFHTPYIYIFFLVFYKTFSTSRFLSCSFTFSTIKFTSILLFCLFCFHCLPFISSLFLFNYSLSDLKANILYLFMLRKLLSSLPCSSTIRTYTFKSNNKL